MERTAEHKKSWLSPRQQVEHLKSKGVRFDLMSEDEAELYLSAHNNYFRLRSYRTGFAKVEEGHRKDQYANLDFKMLVDLSIIDMLLRNEMLPMTLDVEHFSKVKLLTAIEAYGEDGYSVVADFLSSYDEPGAHGSTANKTKAEIDRGKSSPYVTGLIATHPDYGYPAWEFMEVITFGTFIYFCRFCADRFGDDSLLDDFYLLQSVKGLRNACAHNNCIINDMAAGNPKHGARYAVTKELSRVRGIGPGQRKSKMSNERFQQIATTMYMHRLLASKGVHRSRALSLNSFSTRMNKHLSYYEGNSQVTSGFAFLTKIIDSWFPVEDPGLANEAAES